MLVAKLLALAPVTWAFLQALHSAYELLEAVWFLITLFLLQLINNILGSLQVLEDFSLFLVKLEALQKECRKDLSSKKASKLVSII